MKLRITRELNWRVKKHHTRILSFVGCISRLIFNNKSDCDEGRFIYSSAPDDYYDQCCLI